MEWSDIPQQDNVVVSERRVADGIGEVVPQVQRAGEERVAQDTHVGLVEHDRINLHPIVTGQRVMEVAKLPPPFPFHEQNPRGVIDNGDGERLLVVVISRFFRIVLDPDAVLVPAQVFSGQCELDPTGWPVGDKCFGLPALLFGSDFFDVDDELLSLVAVRDDIRPNDRLVVDIDSGRSVDRADGQVSRPAG